MDAFMRGHRVLLRLWRSLIGQKKFFEINVLYKNARDVNRQRLTEQIG